MVCNNSFVAFYDTQFGFIYSADVERITSRMLFTSAIFISPSPFTSDKSLYNVTDSVLATSYPSARSISRDGPSFQSDPRGTG